MQYLSGQETLQKKKNIKTKLKEFYYFGNRIVENYLEGISYNLKLKHYHLYIYIPTSYKYLLIIVFTIL